ncbi:MAG: tRNA (adenosine(37)-N6)-threonylcarbamoyltransferase complex dimerization subunit type 1 TsaB [Acidobacteriaceae bacterium]|nr:tRNA (adenosine(37)-N6)-threonylcarbamoyltransferase complex dimerization subunit type 1 TsaB [Acidobacteriaceae bacterium]
MTILALDTTSEHGSVAIRSKGQTLAEVTIHSPEGFAHLIFQAIGRALDKAGLGLADLDCLAAANGPGSFTGIRVGLSAVKGLAEALGKPAVGVSNLQALSSFGKNRVRAVVLDARRGEVYSAVYNSDLTVVAPETVSPFPKWLETLMEPDYEFISPRGNPFWLALQGTRFADMPFSEVAHPLASAVALCAERAVWTDPALLDANYVRRSDAELFWKDS